MDELKCKHISVHLHKLSQITIYKPFIHYTIHMKKLLTFGLIASSTLLLTACGNKEEAQQETPTPRIDQETILLNNEITMTPQEAIQTYLANADLE